MPGRVRGASGRPGLLVLPSWEKAGPEAAPFPFHLWLQGQIWGLWLGQGQWDVYRKTAGKQPVPGISAAVHSTGPGPHPACQDPGLD